MRALSVTLLLPLLAAAGRLHSRGGGLGGGGHGHGGVHGRSVNIRAIDVKVVTVTEVVYCTVTIGQVSGTQAPTSAVSLSDPVIGSTD